MLSYSSSHKSTLPQFVSSFLVRELTKDQGFTSLERLSSKSNINAHFKQPCSPFPSTRRPPPSSSVHNKNPITSRSYESSTQITREAKITCTSHPLPVLPKRKYNHYTTRCTYSNPCTKPVYVVYSLAKKSGRGMRMRIVIICVVQGE